MDDIKISLSQVGPNSEISIIRVDGVVDTITASELENVIENLVGQKRYKILVDLGGVEYISSAGWGIFVSKIQEVRDNDGDIKLANMIPNVYEIYELLEFEHIIPAYDNLEQGKIAFNIPATESSSSVEKVWKANDKVVTASGTAMQTAFSPGTRGKLDDSQATAGIKPPKTKEGAILHLVAEDPFSSISEMCHDAAEIAPAMTFGWWSVFAILRRNGLLSRRSRFRLARQQNKRR
ncbi:MAG: STAS domain-containing protein [candidate division Zixibacteria bacterium]|nr:STAS domain-containing protein [candidate division Zixibacteria bacterium]